MADLATLQQMLAEAEVALHQLNTGRATTSVSYEGKSVSYQQADLAKLSVYVNQLREQISTLEGRVTRRGPIYASF